MKRTPPLGISRRRFIKGGAISLSGLLLQACGGGGSANSASPVVTPAPPTDNTSGKDTPGQVDAAQSPKSIIILGAGAAGLVAGFELQRAGHDVLLLKARERVGGRIYTLREPFSDGLFAEAGASRIPSNHDVTLDYCQYFNLALSDFYPDVHQYFYLQNESVQLFDAQSHLAQPPWPGGVTRGQFQKLSDGMETLPVALLNAYSGDVRFNSVVTSVSQHNSGVSVVTEAGEQYSADYLLCTVPLPVLNRIAFSPQLTQEKQQAIGGGYGYAQSSRLFSQCETRFWENDNLNGWGDSNFPEEVWHPNWDGGQNSGILQSYMRRDAALQFESLDADTQIASVHGRLRRVFPTLSEHLTSTIVHSWSNEIYSGAAFADPTATQRSTLHNHLGIAEGRVHFAGEHISDFHGWIQGALQSGIRAATEIHSA
ncbi:MAG: flavin monoamine oxidase family protein [Aestuariibacter sp.]